MVFMANSDLVYLDLTGNGTMLSKILGYWPSFCKPSIRFPGHPWDQCDECD